MNHRLRIVIVLALVVVLGCLTFALFSNREPRYQGRTLTEWIKEGHGAAAAFYGTRRKSDTAELESDPDWQAASHAVKLMCPDAISFILRWSATEDSGLKRRLILWINPFLPPRIRVTLSYENEMKADVGFMLLGTAAKPAWPVLIERACSTNELLSLKSYLWFVRSKPDKETLKVALLRLAYAPAYSVRIDAAEEFHRNFPDDAETKIDRNRVSSITNSSLNPHQ